MTRGKPGPALARDGIDHREIELLRFRRQLKEKVLGQRDDFVAPGIGPVDLVDHDDRTETQFERPGEDRPGLGHRAFDRVDQKQAAVGHVEDALDLAAEVGVAGCVDHIDFDAGVDDRHVLGKDRDASFALERIGIHDQLTGGVRIAKDVALLEQAIHQRRLAVVDVGDDGDIAKLCRGGWGGDGHVCLTLLWMLARRRPSWSFDRGTRIPAAGNTIRPGPQGRGTGRFLLVNDSTTRIMSV